MKPGEKQDVTFADICPLVVTLFNARLAGRVRTERSVFGQPLEYAS